MGILKYILLFVIVLVGCNSIYSQNYFYKVYNSGSSDIGEGACQLPDSSYLVTGSTGGMEYGSSQLFVMKVNSKGERLWTKDKGGAESESGRRIFFLDDTVYVFGRTNSFGNSMDYYFLKLDTLGNTIEEKTLGTPNYDWLQDAVFVPKDSTFMLYGYEQANDSFERWKTLHKIDRNGTILWQEKRSTHLDSQLKSLRIFNDTMVVALGSQYNPERNQFDGIARFYNYNGNIVDSLVIYEDGSKDFCLNDLEFSKSTQNRYYLLGAETYLQNDTLFKSKKVMTYHFVNKSVTITDSGNDKTITAYEYILRHRGSDEDYLLLERAKISNFGVIGNDEWDEFSVHCTGSSAIYLTSGVSNISSFGDDITNQIITTLDNGFLLVGYNEGRTNFQKSVFLNKIGANFEAVPNFSSPDIESLVKVQTINDYQEINVYPNPVKNFLHISSELAFNSVQIVSLDGKLMLGTNQSVIDVSELKQGTYFLLLETATTIYQSKFIKK